MIKKQFSTVVLIGSALIVGFGCSKNNDQTMESSSSNIQKENYLALFNPRETSQVVTISAGGWGLWEVIVPPSEKNTSSAYPTVHGHAPSFVLQFEFNNFEEIRLSWGDGGSFGFSNSDGGLGLPGPVNLIMSSAGYTPGLLGAVYAENFLSEWRKDHEVLSLRQFFEDYGTTIQEEPSEK
jgi:hypothetical protein